MELTSDLHFQNLGFAGFLDLAQRRIDLQLSTWGLSPRFGTRIFSICGFLTLSFYVFLPFHTHGRKG